MHPGLRPVAAAVTLGVALAAAAVAAPRTHTPATAPSTLTITRANPLHQPGPEFAPVTVTDAATVHTLYHALLALPAFPNGAFSCPADFGVTYTLVFRADGAQPRTATVDPSGCTGVQISGQHTARWALNGSGPAFLARLQELTGLSAAAFRGMP